MNSFLESLTEALANSPLRLTILGVSFGCTIFCIVRSKGGRYISNLPMVMFLSVSIVRVCSLVGFDNDLGLELSVVLAILIIVVLYRFMPYIFDTTLFQGYFCFFMRYEEAFRQSPLSIVLLIGSIWSFLFGFFIFAEGVPSLLAFVFLFLLSFYQNSKNYFFYRPLLEEIVEEQGGEIVLKKCDWQEIFVILKFVCLKRHKFELKNRLKSQEHTFFFIAKRYLAFERLYQQTADFIQHRGGSILQTLTRPEVFGSLFLGTTGLLGIYAQSVFNSRQQEKQDRSAALQYYREKIGKLQGEIVDWKPRVNEEFCKAANYPFTSLIPFSSWAYSSNALDFTSRGAITRVPPTVIDSYMEEQINRLIQYHTHLFKQEFYAVDCNWQWEQRVERHFNNSIDDLRHSVLNSMPREQLFDLLYNNNRVIDGLIKHLIYQQVKSLGLFNKDHATELELARNEGRIGSELYESLQPPVAAVVASPSLPAWEMLFFES